MKKEIIEALLHRDLTDKVCEFIQTYYKFVWENPGVLLIPSTRFHVRADIDFAGLY